MEFTTLLVTVEFIYYKIKADTDKSIQLNYTRSLMKLIYFRLSL